MSKRYLIDDKGILVPVHRTDDGRFTFPTRSGRSVEDLLPTLDPLAKLFVGIEGVVALVGNYSKAVRITGPGAMELWSDLGFSEEVQSSLRISYRSCMMLEQSPINVDPQLIALQKQNLRRQMTYESICLVDHYEQQASRSRSGGSPEQEPAPASAAGEDPRHTTEPTHDNVRGTDGGGEAPGD